MPCPIDICHSELVEESLFARRSPAVGDDLKRDMAQIPLLFVMRDDLKRDMAQIPLLFVSMLELCWGLHTAMFADCENLLTLRLPKTISAMEEDAFWKCSCLEHLYMPKGIRTLSDKALNGTPPFMEVHAE